MTEKTSNPEGQSFTFKAETKQRLNILIHSLYKDRDVFLRELLSNASDALNRIRFEMLTNQDVLDPKADLSIRITPDKDAATLTIQDTGIGMTKDEITENLGTIAQSGAHNFIEAAKDKDIDRLMAVMADDVVKMVTSDTFFEDREGVKEFFLGFFERGINPSWEVSKIDVAKSGELAYALIKLDHTRVNEDETVTHINSGTFQILKKQTDGNWKIIAFF